jgi:peptidyl-tRNA hydrolase
MESFPVLYVLARTDLQSMNSGKLAAQTCHAGSAFAKQMESSEDTLYIEWRNQTSQGFGTVLVLGVTEQQMQTANKIAKQLGFVADIVTDPTYPAHLDKEAVDVDSPRWTLPCVPAGDKMVTFRNETTCGFIFGDKNNPILGAIVGNFRLHP